MHPLSVWAYETVKDKGRTTLTLARGGNDLLPSCLLDAAPHRSIRKMAPAAASQLSCSKLQPAATAPPTGETELRHSLSLCLTNRFDNGFCYS